MPWSAATRQHPMQPALARRLAASSRLSTQQLQAAGEDRVYHMLHRDASEPEAHGLT
eukprot:SAG11_NODE_9400_length_916_cov_0.735618_2_plen_56_part_01